jgi:predicted small secreted protein
MLFRKDRKMSTFRTGRSLARVLLAFAITVGTLTLLAACNTTAGVGQDVSATGRAVTNSADKVKSGL